MKIFQSLYKMVSISVDGNISSGKSTLVAKLMEEFPRMTTRRLDLEVIPEPLDAWCNMRGHNLLSMFYEDPVKNNFLFQHFVQLTRLRDTVRKAQELRNVSLSASSAIPVRLMERSLQNNRHCFIELGLKQGSLQPAEHSVLAEWYSWLDQNLDLKLDLIVYLQTTPEVVYQRMKKRGRAEESSVPLEYLAALHETYQDWLVRRKSEDSLKEQEVVIINADQSKEDVLAEATARIRERLHDILEAKVVNGLKGASNGYYDSDTTACN